VAVAPLETRVSACRGGAAASGRRPGAGAPAGVPARFLGASYRCRPPTPRHLLLLANRSPARTTVRFAIRPSRWSRAIPNPAGAPDVVTRPAPFGWQPALDGEATARGNGRRPSGRCRERKVTPAARALPVARCVLPVRSACVVTSTRRLVATSGARGSSPARSGRPSPWRSRLPLVLVTAVAMMGRTSASRARLAARSTMSMSSHEQHGLTAAHAGCSASHATLTPGRRRRPVPSRTRRARLGATARRGSPGARRNSSHQDRGSHSAAAAVPDLRGIRYYQVLVETAVASATIALAPRKMPRGRPVHRREPCATEPLDLLALGARPRNAALRAHGGQLVHGAGHRGPDRVAGTRATRLQQRDGAARAASTSASISPHTP